jgi:membrane associated rhomboid family serine protease
MTHSEKLQKMYAHLPALGITPYTAAPPLYRLLWSLGIEIPPPIFSPFLMTAALMGVFFAIGWGSIMWFISWSRDPDFSVTSAAVAAVVAGLLFGLIMASYLKYKSKQLNLPPWSEYKG